jgi:hypothetical protein
MHYTACYLLSALGRLFNSTLTVAFTNTHSAGDTVPQVALACGAEPGSFFASREAVIALLSTLIVLPISALRDLHKLALASFVSVAAVVLIVGIVLFAGEPLLLSTANAENAVYIVCVQIVLPVFQ